VSIVTEFEPLYAYDKFKSESVANWFWIPLNPLIASVITVLYVTVLSTIALYWYKFATSVSESVVAYNFTSFTSPLKYDAQEDDEYALAPIDK